MSKHIQITPIEADATPRGFGGDIDRFLQGVLDATAEHYGRIGFNVPWISYLAVDGQTPVGVCSFKSTPVDGRVEIAYFTFPSYEGRGVATAMAEALVDIGLAAADVEIVAAQTLPERNASHRVLDKLKFVCIGELEHEEDGTVLEWQLRKSGAPAASR